jgi:xanthine dehydrogenase YagR molybdenum-binding subunit
VAKPPTTRHEIFPSGIVGAELSPVERIIPADEPPALPINNELDVIGKRTPRLDGRAMVTGTARYTVDVKLPNMLFARMLRSPHPHARVLLVDTAAAEHHPGVRAIHIVHEPGGQEVQTVRYCGAAIAAVAATSRSAAEEALALIRVEYDLLPFVVDMNEARQPYAPSVLDLGPEPNGSDPLRSANVWGPTYGEFTAKSRGDVTHGFNEADVIVEGEFRTQVQTHCCLEPHAIVADWQPDRLTVYTSTQNVCGVRDEISEAFGLPPDKVHVISEFMGGGFGSKLSAGDYSLMAIELSRKAGAPVSLVLDRQEEQIAAGNRPGTWQRLRIGARRDGTLKAISVLAYGTAGIEMGAGVGNIAQGLYACPNFAMTQYDVMTNAGPACAMRAPGNVQGAFALEQLIDELAERLGLDPIALRDRIDPNPARREERQIGAARVGWPARHLPGADPGPVKRGIGMAQSFWPGIVDTTGACAVRIGRDGSVELGSGVQDIGTGTRTVLGQVVAEEFGLRADDITVLIGDSDFPPGLSSGGSKMTGAITPAARNAAYKALHALYAVVAPKLGASADELVAKGGRIFKRASPASGLGFREAAAILEKDISVVSGRSADYGGFRLAREGGGLAMSDIGGVQFALVAVDTETGTVRVERVVAVHDCGRPINPMQVESQIHGGILMGMSYALFENRLMDRNSGSMVNADLENYKLAGPADTPAIDVVLLENYHGRSSTDACGVAEPATIATAAAIANALYNAIGVRVRSLPMNSATVLAAMGKIPDSGWHL